MKLMVAVRRPPPVGLNDTSIGHSPPICTSARQPLLLIQKSLGLAPVIFGARIAVGAKPMLFTLNTCGPADAAPPSVSGKSAPAGCNMSAGMPRARRTTEVIE